MTSAYIYEPRTKKDVKEDAELSNDYSDDGDEEEPDVQEGLYACPDDGCESHTNDMKTTTPCAVWYL